MNENFELIPQGNENRSADQIVGFETGITGIAYRPIYADDRAHLVPRLNPESDFELELPSGIVKIQGRHPVVHIKGREIHIIVDDGGLLTVVDNADGDEEVLYAETSKKFKVTPEIKNIVNKYKEQ
jgi:hypothetical protein